MHHTSLGPLNTTSFLFDDPEDKHLSLNGVGELTSPVAKAYLQLGGEDKFPTLRSNRVSGLVRAPFVFCVYISLTNFGLSYPQIQLLWT